MYVHRTIVVTGALTIDANTDQSPQRKHTESDQEVVISPTTDRPPSRKETNGHGHRRDDRKGHTGPDPHFEQMGRFCGVHAVGHAGGIG